MKDIITLLENQLHPVKALLIYQTKKLDNRNTYIETYDIDQEGRPINAHPLTIEETTALAQALDSGSELNRNFLKSRGIIPKSVIKIDPSYNGYVIWHTPQKQVDMLFNDTLQIPNGKAYVPPLVWKASKESLYIYALKDAKAIKESTVLYKAPFFNVYENALVCMGNVKIDFSDHVQLEEFIQKWEAFFWNSYFSHTIGTEVPIDGNIIQLWKNQVSSLSKFPSEVLVNMNKALKIIL